VNTADLAAALAHVATFLSEHPDLPVISVTAQNYDGGVDIHAPGRDGVTAWAAQLGTDVTTRIYEGLAHHNAYGAIGDRRVHVFEVEWAPEGDGS
jgi:hypothetical protein